MKCYKNQKVTISQYDGITIIDTIIPLYKRNKLDQNFCENSNESKDDEFEYRFKKVSPFYQVKVKI
jgi:hypothetical protein